MLRLRQLSTITQKGQITIPFLIRQELAFKPGRKVVFILEDKMVKIEPAANFFSLRGSVPAKKPFNLKKMREAAKKELAKRHESVA